MVDNFSPPGGAPEAENRTYKGWWVEGTDGIAHKPEDEIARELAKIIKETPNIYTLSVHTIMGVYIQTLDQS